MRTTLSNGDSGLDGVDDIIDLVGIAAVAGTVGRHRMVKAVRVKKTEDGQGFMWNPICNRRERGCVS